MPLNECMQTLLWQNVVLQTMYNGLLENSCSENASRVAAMDSSTNNASDLLSKLTLSYNRWVTPASLAFQQGKPISQVLR